MIQQGLLSDHSDLLKTQEFVQTVLFDLPQHRALADALVRLARQRARHETLFQVTPNQLREVLAEAAVALRLGRIHPLHLP